MNFLQCTTSSFPIYVFAFIKMIEMIFSVYVYYFGLIKLAVVAVLHSFLDKSYNIIGYHATKGCKKKVPEQALKEHNQI